MLIQERVALGEIRFCSQIHFL